MKKIRIFTILTCLVAQLSYVNASPYDHCEQAFIGGKFNTTLSVLSEDKAMSLKLWLCSQQERTSSNNDSFDSAASYLGIFEGNGNYSKSRYKN
jgi:hypothetical protein